MSKQIIWTLQNSCPEKWIDKFIILNFRVIHQPLIQLKLNQNINQLWENIKKYNFIIVTSQFSAKYIIKVLKGKHNVLSIGEISTSLLRNAGHNVIYTANNSIELAHYISENIKSKILHICSNKSDKKVWPNNVDLFPFYGPITNSEFNINNKSKSHDIPVFGSPSGVNAWMNINGKCNHNTIAAIGNTTAKHIPSKIYKYLIVPEKSTINSLCSAIHENIEKYEKTK